jgi:dTDP-4-amino-4,6-dideoxygalactose transaminase
MNVPFLDLKAQYQSIKEEINSKILEVCENTAFALGKYVHEFEGNFASFIGTKHAMGLNSGTAADHIAIKSVIEPGDEVITVPNTFIATSESITAAGGKVVFCDIEEDSYNMDWRKFEAAITPKTKAVVPVHLYGQPADMDPILEVARKHNLVVIEDAAQAHGALYKGKKAGSLADAAAWSFYPGKNLGAYGEAGAITTDRDDIADYTRVFRDHGMREKYIHEMEGHNMRMEGFQGAVLNVKLKYIEQWSEARRKHAALYDQLLTDVAGVIPPRQMDYARHVYHLYVIRVEEREKLQQFLADKGIGSGFHYKFPLHLQKAYDYLGHKKGDFPVTENVMKEILSLPMYPEMTEDMVYYVVESIKEFLNK